MLNPYPSRAELRTEAAADRLLLEQSTAVTAFRAIVQAALDGIRKLEFPLASPAPGYDVEDIESFLSDWLVVRTDAVLEELALDAARDEDGWRGLAA